MKKWLREFRVTRPLYRKLKDVRDHRLYKIKTEVKHKFIDRSKGSNKLCIVLAGYKQYLYDDVFDRIKYFIPEDIDVCIVSSGIYSEVLKDIAKSNEWSYLSTERNCVTLAQNITILRHPKADYIYKIDEDIFVTQNCFERMMETLHRVEAEGPYKIGFVAPLIPINGYGHLRILEKLGLSKLYGQKFERPIYASYGTRMIEKSSEVARFFWGEGDEIPSIDSLNDAFQKLPFEYSVCPIRFSIGFILIKRAVWEAMGMWKVIPDNTCMGMDEEQICSYCMINSHAIIVSENAVAGHMSFGQQNEEMKKYYLQHRERFRCPEV